MSSAIPSIPFRPQPQARAERQGQPAPGRRAHRERDFGVGYGSSSGYASDRRYSPRGAQPRFRFG